MQTYSFVSFFVATRSKVQTFTIASKPKITVRNTKQLEHKVENVLPLANHLAVSLFPFDFINQGNVDLCNLFEILHGSIITQCNAFPGLFSWRNSFPAWSKIVNQIEGNIALFDGLGAFNQPVSKDLKQKTYVLSRCYCYWYCALMNLPKCNKGWMIQLN